MHIRPTPTISKPATDTSHASRFRLARSVEPGELIGYVGSTGRSAGPRLHYEVRKGGVAILPLPYIQGQ